MIDKGVYLICGSTTHTLQGVKTKGDKAIRSLTNCDAFLNLKFGSWHITFNSESCLVSNNF